MGWRELQAWLAAMKRQLEPKTTPVDSWQGADQDAWWVSERARRERERAERYGRA